METEKDACPGATCRGPENGWSLQVAAATDAASAATRRGKRWERKRVGKANERFSDATGFS
jgi:hypothetical protein